MPAQMRGDDRRPANDNNAVDAARSELVHFALCGALWPDGSRG